MAKKKKKSSAAENLIESLMDDLKGIEGGNSSYHDEFAEPRAKNEAVAGDAETQIPTSNVWEGFEQNASSDDLDAAEFSGVGEDLLQYTSDVEEDDPYGSDEDSEYSSVKEQVESSGSPEGFDFEGLPPSENFEAPEAPEAPDAFIGGYDGPALGEGVYQSVDDLASEIPEAPAFPEGLPEESGDETKPVHSPLHSEYASENAEDKTISLQQQSGMTGTSDADKTLAVDGFANIKVGARKKADVDVKVSIGGFRGGRGASSVMTSMDASLAQAENLKLAQRRILELEQEVETLRAENEELASAGEIIRHRADELSIRVTAIEKEKEEERESAQSEALILKGNLKYKETEVAKARLKIEELETRLKSDFKKIRVRERELENRLELLRAEKSALVRSKDEYILELKRKIDQLSMELDNYRKKCLELNKAIDANQDQVKRTERALRLALSNLEAKEENLVPLKKAE